MKQLLTIAPPVPTFPRETLDAPGGFLWWYADMIDAHGNGLVLIWSFGLPFLPGYADASRRGEPELPRQRPSLNIAVLEQGELACYLLHEFEPDEVEWHGDRWRFGDTRIETSTHNGVRELRLDLDCPLPGGQRLTGDVRISGTARLESPVERSAQLHDWAPLTAMADGVATLNAAGHRYEINGRAYFDGNYGTKPLASEISAWTWGRIPFADRDAIYYILWRDLDAEPEATGIELHADGHLEASPIDVVFEEHKRGMAGLRFPSAMQLLRDGKPWLHVTAGPRVDDGPFYVRHLIDVGGTVGMGEYCRTDMIDLGLHRPLVRMRVQRSDGANSMWLPLFAGPREGRARRLLTHWAGA